MLKKNNFFISSNMVMEIDYYSVLGLKRTSSNFDILNAYVPNLFNN